MYGHGHSDGEFSNHTLLKWMNNALTVIDYARGLEWVSDLFLCGHSQGGLLVMLAAGMKHDVISGLIPMSPGSMVPELAREGIMLDQHFDPEHIPEVLHFREDLELKGNYVRVAQTIHVEEFIDRYQGPVLIIHGDEDEMVPVRYGIEAARRYKNAQLTLIPGDDHCYTRHLDMVMDALRTWLKAQLG